MAGNKQGAQVAVVDAETLEVPWRAVERNGGLYIKKRGALFRSPSSTDDSILASSFGP